jgi:transcriptional regulator with XRE-family HTH domain
MNAKFFWGIVKKEVERQNTSFEWLYRKTQIPKGTFSSWKNRKTIPRADEAFLIANALKVSVEYLLTGVDQPIETSNKAVHELTKTVPFFDDYDLQTILAAVRSMAVRYQRKSDCIDNNIVRN